MNLEYYGFLELALRSLTQHPKISKICVLWIFWNWKPVIIPQAVAGVSRSRDAAPPVRDLETQAFHKYDFTRQVRFSRKTSTMSPAVVDCSHRGDVRTPSPAPLQYTESLPNSLDIWYRVFLPRYLNLIAIYSNLLTDGGKQMIQNRGASYGSGPPRLDTRQNYMIVSICNTGVQCIQRMRDTNNELELITISSRGQKIQNLVNLTSELQIFGFSRMRLRRSRATQRELRDAISRDWGLDTIKNGKTKTFFEKLFVQWKFSGEKSLFFVHFFRFQFFLSFFFWKNNL